MANWAATIGRPICACKRTEKASSRFTKISNMATLTLSLNNTIAWVKNLLCYKKSISSSAYSPGSSKHFLLKTLKMSYVCRCQPLPLIQQTKTFLKLISPKLTSSPTLVPAWNTKSICRYALLLSSYIDDPEPPYTLPHPFFDHDLEPSNTTLPRHPLPSCGSRGFMFLYLVCFSDRPLFELKEGQWWDMDWKYNGACQNMNERRSMSVSDYGASLSVGLKWLRLTQSPIRSSVTDTD